MREYKVVKLLIKQLCKTADGRGFTKWWIPQQYLGYINILLIYSMPEVLASTLLTVKLMWQAYKVKENEGHKIPDDNNLEDDLCPRFCWQFLKSAK